MGRGRYISENDVYIDLLHEKPNRILDFGCGKGELIDELLKLNCKWIQGLEVSSEFRRENVLIVEDSIAYLESNPEKYDLIIARESLYYIPKSEQVRLWTALHNSLVQGGTLAIIVLNGALQTSQWVIQKDHGIQFIFNEVLLKHFAQIVGLQNQRIFAIRSTHHTLIGKIGFTMLSTVRSLITQFTFISERGIDRNNPTIFSKSLLFLGSRNINKEANLEF